MAVEGDIIDISAFASEIETTLSQYSKNVKSEAEKWMQTTAKKTVKRIKAKAPVRTGKYMKGWTAKKVDGNWIVFNKARPGLTHLLEKGHPIVKNGKYAGQAKAFPHIKPAETEIQNDIDELEKSLKEVKA